MTRLNNPRYARPRPLTDQDWALRALCRGRDPQWDSDAALSDKRAAMRVCQTCPVLNECTVAGRDEPYGIWGGVDKKNPALSVVPVPSGNRGPSDATAAMIAQVEALARDGATVQEAADAVGKKPNALRHRLRAHDRRDLLDVLVANRKRASARTAS